MLKFLDTTNAKRGGLKLAVERVTTVGTGPPQGPNPVLEQGSVPLGLAHSVAEPPEGISEPAPRGQDFFCRLSLMRFGSKAVASGAAVAKGREQRLRQIQPIRPGGKRHLSSSAPRAPLGIYPRNRPG